LVNVPFVVVYNDSIISDLLFNKKPALADKAALKDAQRSLLVMLGDFLERSDRESSGFGRSWLSFPFSRSKYMTWHLEDDICYSSILLYILVIRLLWYTYDILVLYYLIYYYHSSYLQTAHCSPSLSCRPKFTKEEKERILEQLDMSPVSKEFEMLTR